MHQEAHVARVAVGRQTKIGKRFFGGVSQSNRCRSAAAAWRAVPQVSRLLLDPSGDVRRLHGGDRPHPVGVAPGHELRRGVGVGPPRVRVADVGCREFQEAERGAISGGGDQRWLCVGRMLIVTKLDRLGRNTEGQGPPRRCSSDLSCLKSEMNTRPKGLLKRFRTKKTDTDMGV